MLELSIITELIQNIGGAMFAAVIGVWIGVKAYHTESKRATDCINKLNDLTEKNNKIMNELIRAIERRCEL